MIFFGCVHFSLVAMQPHGLNGLRRVQRCFQQLSAHLLRPGHVHVFMNDAKIVTLSPDAKKPITISTAGLIGCTATVLYARDVTAQQYAILMHYHPNNHQDHLIELEQQMQVLVNSTKLFRSMKFLSVQPEDNYWLDQAAHTANCRKERNALEEMVKKFAMNFPVDMLHATYDLPPSGKGYFTEVHVTLANNIPSKARVINWATPYQCELE